jgi:nucleotide-binding universal stress UspA family protein
LEADARERLSKAIPEDARAWCEAEEMVTTGRAYREILRVAKEQQADVIVMGIHAHGAIDRMFFGSTANHVVREATCPVLTVRRRAHPAAASRPVSLAG